MRLISAVIATLASLAMLVIGGLQFADASRQTTATASGTTNSSAPLMVVDDSVLASRAGAQLVQVEGDGDITVVIGRTADVKAWVGDAKHTTVSVDENDQREDGQIGLRFDEGGTEAEVPNPISADQWFERHEGNGSFRLDTVVAPGYSMLIAADGKAPAPNTLSITWPAAGYAPLSGPLLVAGGVLLLVAIALWIWVIRHRKRAAQERRDNQEELAAAGTPGAASGYEDAPRWSVVPWEDEQRDGAADATDAPAADDASEASLPDEDAPAVAPAVAETESSADEAAVVEQDVDQTTEHEDAVAEADQEIETILEAHDPDKASPFAPQHDVTAEETDEPVDEPEVTAEQSDAVVEEGDEVEEPVSTLPTSTAYQPDEVQETEPTVSDSAPTEGEQSDSEPAEPEPAQEETAQDATQSEPSSSAEPTASEPTSKNDDDDEWKWRRPRGRNRSNAPKRVFFAPVVVVASLGLAGCAPQYWPADWTNTDVNPQATPTSTVDAAIIDEGAHPPSLNDAQIQQIIDDAAAVAADADEKQDAKALERRFTGDALALRAAQYKAHKANEKNPLPATFPTGEIVYSMPESSDQWPRTLFAVVKPAAKEGEGQTPYAMMLTQESPRENYKVAAETQLAPNATLPDAAPSSIGSSSLANLPGPLVIEPDKLAAAYADVIAQGDKSPHAGTFEAEGDSLRASVNDAYRKKESEAIDGNVAKLSFDYKASDTKPVGMVGLNDGAIVSVSIREIETLRAANDRARIKMTGLTAELAGVTETSTGFAREYTDQLLFYVPAKSDGGKVQFLGVSQAMTSARELEAQEVSQ